MRYQIIGFNLSLVIHGVIILIMMSIGQGLSEKSKRVSLNLSILETEIIEKNVFEAVSGSMNPPQQIRPEPIIPIAPPPPSDAIKKNHAPKAVTKRSVERTAKKSPPVASKPSPAPDPRPSPARMETPAETPPDALGSADIPTELRQGATDLSDITNTVERESGEAGMGMPTTSKTHRTGSGSSGTVKESGEGNAYLEANFDSIRNRLRESLVYPKIARKLGLSGEVIVSFLVLPNGTVQDVRIKKSCGIAVLDGSAMQTIENACPFPGPPAVARIVIPIIFQLKSTHPSS